MNASWQKTKVQNRGTGLLYAAINVDGNIFRFTEFTWAPISGQNRRRTDIANQT